MIKNCRRRTVATEAAVLLFCGYSPPVFLEGGKSQNYTKILTQKRDMQVYNLPRQCYIIFKDLSHYYLNIYPIIMNKTRLLVEEGVA